MNRSPTDCSCTGCGLDRNRDPPQAEVFSQAEAQLQHASMQRRQISWCPACGLQVASQSRHTCPQTRAMSFRRDELCAEAVTRARHIWSISDRRSPVALPAPERRAQALLEHLRRPPHPRGRLPLATEGEPDRAG